MADSATPHARLRIDVISDAICPWCYIGKRRLEAALPILAAAGLTATVQWNPYQLNPDMPAEGVERSAYRMAKFGGAERAAAIDARITEAAAAVGLDFHTERMRRTPNTVAAHRLIALAGAACVQDAVVEALFAAYFIDGHDIGDADTLAAIAEGAGLPGAEVQTMLAGTAWREEVLAADTMARRAGIEGVPSFALERHVIFSGALPGETMAEAFIGAARTLAGTPS